MLEIGEVQRKDRGRRLGGSAWRLVGPLPAPGYKGAGPSEAPEPARRARDPLTQPSHRSPGAAPHCGERKAFGAEIYPNIVFKTPKKWNQRRCPTPGSG